MQYFFKLTGIADDESRTGHYPGRIEAEDARLSGYKVIDVPRGKTLPAERPLICPLANSTAPPSHRGEPSKSQGTTSKPTVEKSNSTENCIRGRRGWSG